MSAARQYPGRDRAVPAGQAMVTVPVGRAR